MQQTLRYDVLIIGSGAAGLTLALCLPEHLHVAIVSKGCLSEGSTLYAQGGVSAALDQTDSIESHIEDTLNAGAGLCDLGAVRYVVEQGPDCIHRLIDQGVHFTRENESSSCGAYHLTHEGGHSHRRVINADDVTGREI